MINREHKPKKHHIQPPSMYIHLLIWSWTPYGALLYSHPCMIPGRILSYRAGLKANLKFNGMSLDEANSIGISKWNEIHRNGEIGVQGLKHGWVNEITQFIMCTRVHRWRTPPKLLVYLKGQDLSCTSAVVHRLLSLNPPFSFSLSFSPSLSHTQSTCL